MKIIMNPPYNRNLHLKILSHLISLYGDAEVVNLSPIRWLQDPLSEYKKYSDWQRFIDIRKKIETLDIVPKSDAYRLFDITNSEDLGIYHITKKGGWKSSKEKELIKRCYTLIKDNLCKIDHNMKDGWRIRVSLISNNNHRTGAPNNLGKLIIFKDGMKDGSPWYEFYQKNKWSKATPEITDSIRFNSKEEAQNFIESVENTKFGKWYEAHIITDIHISNDNILWLSDYTHPWTDADLYEYFGLNEEEIKEIECSIKL